MDLAAERAVLAGIYSYGTEVYVDISDIITPQSFTDEINQIIFKCLQYALRDGDNTKLDLATVYAATSALGYAEIFNKQTNLLADFRKMLRAISNFPINKDNVRKIAIRIRKLEIARSYVKELAKAQSALTDITGDEPIDKIVALAEKPILDLSNALNQTSNDGPELMGENIHEFLEHLISHPVEQVGVSTGYPIFDTYIGGGLRPGINLIGARPKIGKTTLADNIALHISANIGLPVFNLDTEMNKKAHRFRILANLAEVNVNEIEIGSFAANELKLRKVKEAANILESLPYSYKSVVGRPFDEIISLIRRWVLHSVGLNENGKANPCVIIYDYLKLVDPESLKSMQEYQVLGFQINALHDIMMQYEIPCLAFIQLNRDGINREDTDVASGSDRQIWACTSFSIFKKKSDEELSENAKYNRKMAPIVARYGPAIDEGDYINMNMRGQFAKVLEGPTRNQANNQSNHKPNGFVVNDNEQPKF
jgi:replicative DNA helicase